MVSSDTVSSEILVNCDFCGRLVNIAQPQPVTCRCGQIVRWIESIKTDRKPHQPSAMCVDTCENPIVCREEWDAWQSDQEQTERGASTVSSGRLKAHTEDTLTATEAQALEAIIARPYVEECAQLRAEIEALTAELAETRADVQRGIEWQRGYADRLVESQTLLQQVAAERDAMGEVCDGVSAFLAGAQDGYNGFLVASGVWRDIRPLKAALASLDATRKATAEHPLPERGPGYDPLCQCGQGQLHRLRLHDEATADATEEGK